MTLHKHNPSTSPNVRRLREFQQAAGRYTLKRTRRSKRMQGIDAAIERARKACR